MKEATRRRILTDMGIPQWRLRVTKVPSPVEEDPSPVEEDSASAAPRPSPPRAAAAPPTPETPAVPQPAGPEAPPPPRPVGPAVAPFSVLSVAVAGTVLLLDGVPSKRDLRLARDVLCAASGAWSAKPARRRFDWPPAVETSGVSADADSGARALKAFVDKDLGDHHARQLLVSEAVAGRLAAAWPHLRVIAVPPLERLGRDADAKRALWRALAEPPS